MMSKITKADLEATVADLAEQVTRKDEELAALRDLLAAVASTARVPAAPSGQMDRERELQRRRGAQIGNWLRGEDFTDVHNVRFFTQLFREKTQPADYRPVCDEIVSAAPGRDGFFCQLDPGHDGDHSRETAQAVAEQHESAGKDEEIAALRDLLAAAHELAGTAPDGVPGSDLAESSRMATILSAVNIVCDPEGPWAWSHTTGHGAAYLRKRAAEPLGYEPHETDGDAEHDGDVVTLADEDIPAAVAPYIARALAEQHEPADTAEYLTQMHEAANPPPADEVYAAHKKPVFCLDRNPGGMCCIRQHGHSGRHQSASSDWPQAETGVSTTGHESVNIHHANA